MPYSDHPRASEVEAQLTAICAKEWGWRQAQIAPDEDHPVFLGASLPNVDEGHQQTKLDRWKDVLAQLDTLDVSALSANASIDYRVYRHQVETLLADQHFKIWQRPLGGDTAFWNDVFYAAKAPRKTEEAYRDYIALLDDIPRYFAENIANMRAGLARGFTLPRIVLKGRDTSVAHFLSFDQISENPFFEPFKSMPDTIPAGQKSVLQETAAAVIARKIRPAYAELLRFLWNEYMPGAQDSIAASDLPDGKAFYRSQIAKYTTRPLSPEEIHAFGLAQVEQFSGEMVSAMKDTGFSGDLPAFLAFLRSDSQFYAAEPQGLLNRAVEIVDRIDGKLSMFFKKRPTRRFAVLPVPDDVAPYFTSGRGGLGYYMVNTHKLASRPLYALPALTLHEAAPGHAFQMALAAENNNLPDFRSGSSLAAYCEGWAVYCERLGEEMGVFQTPYERFGMLSYQIWRAARLVVDTGIHALGWRRDEACRFLKDTTALSNHEIATEVDRYIAQPGQALSYFIGSTCLQDARRRAERALGRDFAVSEFHDMVLGLGSVPLDVIEAATDKFVAEWANKTHP